jgi:hypothetical protein
MTEFTCSQDLWDAVGDIDPSFLVDNCQGSSKDEDEKTLEHRSEVASQSSEILLWNEYENGWTTEAFNKYITTHGGWNPNGRIVKEAINVNGTEEKFDVSNDPLDVNSPLKSIQRGEKAFIP